MTRILILGGYGAVGRMAAAGLARWTPDAEVVVGGRRPDRARPVPGAAALRVDAADAADLGRALDGVDAVLMCAELADARVARACLERGVDYVDVSASRDVLARVEALADLASANGATAVLSVGLVPGVSNLLARACVERSSARDRREVPGVRIGVLLGAGERHGRAAVAWTLDGLGQLDGAWTMRFPPPWGERTVHRFPFSDQFTLPATLGLSSASTGLCLDSRAMTAALAAASRPTAARWLRGATVRGLLLGALTAGPHPGSDAFAVVAQAGDARASFSGRLQSRATGLAAALVLRHLPALRPGVAHLEQLVEPVAFLTELAAEGFDLQLG